MQKSRTSDGHTNVTANNKSQQSQISWKKLSRRDVKISNPEATSGKNAKVDSETQTEANSRQRDCANANVQQNVRRLEEKKKKLSILLQENERKIALLHEEIEHKL